MSIKKFTLDGAKAVSIGVIEEIKIKKNGSVKYKILYRDYDGREYSAWTTCMRDDGYRVGDSITVKNVSVPSFGLLNVPLAVNNQPQRYVEPYVAAMVVTGIGALIGGYFIGKSCKK